MSDRSATSANAGSVSEAQVRHIDTAGIDPNRSYQPKITGPEPVLHPPTGIGNVQPAAALVITAPGAAKGTAQ